MTKYSNAPPCPICQTALATNYNGPLPPDERIEARQAREASEVAAARSRVVIMLLYFCHLS
jgi:hypothetical protein